MALHHRAAKAPISVILWFQGFARSLRVVFNWVSFYVGLQAFKAKQRPQRGLLFLKTATPKVAPGKHFFDGLTSWNGQEGGDLDTFTMTRWDPQLVRPSPVAIALAEKRPKHY